ncbi:hypothetical protein IQ235_04165 [Oscillatoriales cyanobacterium LEGE 11467]|uniref:Uncharacterized protein n=1 Tax=Zarconia navalis LEGE 11467 TaxID=1828826 RepID=A0A928Z8M2_9CYAN|nr:hypothetical protein [Zarconia navalis]MBE9039986.1 hypothetical protein [Zarconia navalis LEGE 11467]
MKLFYRSQLSQARSVNIETLDTKTSAPFQGCADRTRAPVSNLYTRLKI